MNSERYISNCDATVSNYKKQEIMMSTPEQCVLHVYDLAIQSCVRNESVQAGRAVAALIDALNFNVNADVSTRLFRLYQYCLHHIHKQEFENPLKILKQLRLAWQKALSNQAAA